MKDIISKRQLYSRRITRCNDCYNGCGCLPLVEKDLRPDIKERTFSSHFKKSSIIIKENVSCQWLETTMQTYCNEMGNESSTFEVWRIRTSGYSVNILNEKNKDPFIHDLREIYEKKLTSSIQIYENEEAKVTICPIQ